jgi:hypothetical protein
MTKVELGFELTRPLDDALGGMIAEAHKVYGIFHIRLDRDLRRFRVEYDATRLTPADVEASLRRLGIPARSVA